MRINTFLKALFCLFVMNAAVANVVHSVESEVGPNPIGISSLGQQLFEGTYSVYNEKEKKLVRYSFYQIYDPRVSLRIQFSPELYQLLKASDEKPRVEGMRSLRKELHDYRVLASLLESQLPKYEKPLPHFSFEIDSTGRKPVVSSVSIVFNNRKTFHFSFAWKETAIERMLVEILRTHHLLFYPEILNQTIEIAQSLSSRLDVQKRIFQAGLHETFSDAEKVLRPLPNHWTNRLKRAFSHSQAESFHRTIEKNYASLLTMVLILNEVGEHMAIPHCENALTDRFLFLSQ